MRTVATFCRDLLSSRRSDGELLTAFLANSSEEAFAELVRRHGPFVWGTCRRLLPNPADAEDAFQAAFLVLVRRARHLTSATTLGPWLHRVTVWTARNVRRKNARRLVRQTELPTQVLDPTSAIDSDLKADLDAALLALPACYRDCIILCHLQGFTRREAAERLGCPEGTLSARLNRGLEKLRHRLSGLDPAKVLGVALAMTAVPSALSASTMRAAVSTTVAAASVPSAVHSLVEGVLRMFWVKKATAATVALFATFALGIGIGVGTRTEYSGVAASEGPEQPTPTAKAKEPPARNFIKEIEELEEQIKAEEIKHQATLDVVQRAQIQLEIARKAHEKGTGSKDDLLDAQLTLARFKENASQSAARLELLKARLKTLIEAKAKAEEKPPVRDFAKEIVELEAKIRALEAILESNLVGAREAEKRVILIAKLKPNSKDEDEARDIAAALQLKAQKTEAELLLLRARLKLLKEEKAKLEEKPTKPEPPKTISLTDLFGKPADLEKQLAEATIQLQKVQAEAEVAELNAILTAKQGKPNQIEAAKAQVARARAEMLVARAHLETVRYKLAAAKATNEPPLKAVGACIEVVVIGSGVCRVREYGLGGKFLGAFITEGDNALELAMTRARKDPSGPRDLWLTVSPDQSPAAILQAAMACKKAGFTKVSINGTLPEDVELPFGKK